MQIRVDKLRKNLALIQPLVPRKSSLPILSHVRLKDGMLTATDLETTVSINLPEAQGDAFLLPFKAVMEVLKYVSGDEILTLDLDGEPMDKARLLKLSWNGGNASYEVKDIRDYPDISAKEPKAEGPLNGDMLISALVAALPYCATDATRPVLCGVTVYLGNVLQIAGADGFRLSYESLKLAYPIQETIVIPAGTIGILAHLWRKEPSQLGLETTLVRQLTSARQLKLSLWEGNMGIQFGNITLISKLIAGTPPDHLALLNNFQEPIKVTLMAPELYNAVRRLEGIARDGTGIVRLWWTETQMTVSARSEEKGEVQTGIPVEIGSNPGRIAVNVRYLLDYLAGKDGLVTIGTTNPSSPALFHYGTRPIVAIMPMFVQWEDEKPVEGKPEVESAEGVPEAAGENPEPGTKGEKPPEPAQEPVVVTAAPKETSSASTSGTEKIKITHKRGGKRKKNPEP